MVSPKQAAKLPFLPGYRVETQPKERYHKAHVFEVHNGVRVDLTSNQLSSDNANNEKAQILSPTKQLSQSLNESKTNDFDSTIKSSINLKSPQSTLNNKTRLPAWVAYDRKVLRFTGWFKEAVHSSDVETWRIRRILLYFYLEDDSIHIAEPKIENSGLPQGVFVKRHRIPKSGRQNEFFGVNDLYIGAELNIYGRVFRLTDADKFTREFYEANQKPLGAYEPTPSDPWTEKTSVGELHSISNNPKFKRHANKEVMEQKKFIEASLGKPPHAGIEQTRQFLTLDRKVLRFYCQWDDATLYGEKRPYILHYYLADDTVEILEIQQPNSGRDAFSHLLKRSKLPVNWTEATPEVSKIGALKDEMYSRYINLTDLRVGGYVNVYGRNLFICGADEFTIDYYCKNYGLTRADFPRINMKDEEDEIRKLTPPPYNGFGNPEDSLGSYLYLMPQVPKHDWKKLIEQDGKMLRFLARFDPEAKNINPYDLQRRFVVTYYLAHDQLSIFEKFERNSGFLGGKFLERTRVLSPEGEYYEPKHLYPGAKIVVNTYRFELLETDEFTKKYMDEHKEIYKH